jgi:hypothetical protein
MRLLSGFRYEINLPSGDTRKDVLIGTLKKFSSGIRSTVPSNEQDAKVNKTNKKK